MGSYIFYPRKWSFCHFWSRLGFVLQHYCPRQLSRILQLFTSILITCTTISTVVCEGKKKHVSSPVFRFQNITLPKPWWTFWLCNYGNSVLKIAALQQVNPTVRRQACPFPSVPPSLGTWRWWRTASANPLPLEEQLDRYRRFTEAEKGQAGTYFHTRLILFNCGNSVGRRKVIPHRSCAPVVKTYAQL